MKKIKPYDLCNDALLNICEILNKGDEVHVKREKDNIVIVRIKRECVLKTPIE